MNDPVTDALTKMRNAETATKKSCELKPASKFLGEILRVAKESNYIKDFKLNEEKGVISYTVELNGKLNTCKGVKPRYAVKKDEYEKYEKRYLPARDVGVLIVSTSKGVMNHSQAKQQGLGGRIVAYIY
jgi:small subunit ribosomal protein S8